MKKCLQANQHAYTSHHFVLLLVSLRPRPPVRAAARGRVRGRRKGEGPAPKRERTPPTCEAATRYSPTPCRVQYHRRTGP